MKTKQWTLDEVRETFLKFFENKGHTVVDSAPLLPAEDKTLLFTNAGMNQFKNVFTGMEKRSYTRATSAQKCVRAGGKHNDLENVGFTDRHHTFFEMLGNFSFGDYFKEGAIKYCWELITEVFKLEKERLYVTVFRDDDEAYDLWKDMMGVPESRIFRLGEKDNFWSMGDTGPCGPCSEIHYDMWDNYESQEHIIDGEPDWDCGRFVEIWNLVFMQFNRDENGKMTPLPKPSIDTGMGLERITAALNGVTSNYDVDIFVNLIEYIRSLLDRKTDPSLSSSFRVIADHARSTTFLIADSITPSNEGRGYVLRRIMRRAIRHGHKLGFSENFFYRVCMKVIELMGHHYPEIIQQKDMIKNIVFEEEKRFRQTLDKGLQLLETGVDKAIEAGEKKLAGELVFKLYDTYGFPPDLTQNILDERNFSYDTDGYKKAMEEQQRKGRSSWSGSLEEKKNLAATVLQEDGFEINNFEGYDKAELDGEILALFNENLDRIDSAEAGLNAYALVSPLLFYAEAGGQVADFGHMERDSEKVADVTNCLKIGEYRIVKIHTETAITVGMKVKQLLDEERRMSIKKNHSATHILHHCLKAVVGKHANQAGSLVTPERLRFDFNHYAPLTNSEILEIEQRVNRMIQGNLNVCTAVSSIEQAKKEGATALFGEKYGETVRVVSMGDSKELCGGTHVKYSGEIGFFSILKEEGIAAGVRRIEAVTGMEAVNIYQKTDETLYQAAASLGVDKFTLPSTVEKVKEQNKTLTKEIEELRAKVAAMEADSIKPLIEKDGIEIYVINSGKGRKESVSLSDGLKSKVKDGLFIITGVEKGKALAIISSAGKAKETYNAGEILRKLLSEFDGKGGGRKDMAQGGAPSIDFNIWKNKVVEIINSQS